MTTAEMRRKPFGRTRKTIEATQSDIRTLLKKYGAKNIVIGERGEKDEIALIEFIMGDLMFRFAQAIVQEEDAARRWRVMYNTIQADLIAKDDEVIKIEERWLANIVDPDTGQTVYDVVGPKLEEFRKRKMLPKGEG